MSNEIAQLGKSTRTMAYAIFHFGWQGSKALFIALRYKNGIVTKSSHAHWLFRNAPPADSLKIVDFAMGIYERNDGPKLCTSVACSF